ncbi:zinc ribbon domain-containing protein YjdM [Robertkochia aurantiaca]|uniref:zinc ribbon domain-containing protein YjdM n=1 Tax=Robertkochia aurantiaca TaxID=2873700 RepID=UPI001CCEB831|nr:zinc ribbon domain-containing protein YjdM [Robertkochia sp. 3YJGBD-33]
MSDEMKACPQCESPYGYFKTMNLYACPECGHEWDPEAEAEKQAQEEQLQVTDVNGNPLQDGDSVIVIKDLPVKGAPNPVKAGTKVKNIRLVEGDHDISCRIEGFGAMGLKSEFVRKA